MRSYEDVYDNSFDRKDFECDITIDSKAWKCYLDEKYKIIGRDEKDERIEHDVLFKKYTITTWGLYHSFEKINQNQPFHKQLKPYNFIVVGNKIETTYKWIDPYYEDPYREMHGTILPLKAYSKKPKDITFGKCIDKLSGKLLYSDEFIWKKLSNYLYNYFIHPERKFEGDKWFNNRKDDKRLCGKLRRRYIKPSFIYTISKEGKHLEEKELGLIEREESDPITISPEETSINWCDICKFFGYAIWKKFEDEKHSIPQKTYNNIARGKNPSNKTIDKLHPTFKKLQSLYPQQ